MSASSHPAPMGRIVRLYAVGLLISRIPEESARLTTGLLTSGTSAPPIDCAMMTRQGAKPEGEDAHRSRRDDRITLPASPPRAVPFHMPGSADETLGRVRRASERRSRMREGLDETLTVLT